MRNRSTGKRHAGVSTSTEQDFGVEGIKAGNGKTPFKSKLAQKKFKSALNGRLVSSDAGVDWLRAAGDRPDHKG
jgi:hypothetical protein